MPKIHLLDSGLAATLIGLREVDWNRKRESFGKILESMALQRITAQPSWKDPTLRDDRMQDFNASLCKIRPLADGVCSSF